MLRSVLRQNTWNHPAGIGCNNCRLNQLCLPAGLGENDRLQLDSIIQRPPPLEPGEYLYRAGDPFHSVYIVRSGSVKTCRPTGNTQSEQVTGVYLPSEFFGLDGIAAGTYSRSAQALETTTVCTFRFHNLEDLAGRSRGFGRRLLEVLGRKMHLDQEQTTLLGKATVDERIAGLLVSLSDRLKQLGFSDREFHLSLSRLDIANYLGHAVETVSRVLSSFQQKGLLKIDRRHVLIQDLPALKKLAGMQSHD